MYIANSTIHRYKVVLEPFSEDTLKTLYFNPLLEQLQGFIDHFIRVSVSGGLFLQFLRVNDSYVYGLKSKLPVKIKSVLFKHQDPDVQRVDSTIYSMNLCPVYVISYPVFKPLGIESFK